MLVLLPVLLFLIWEILPESSYLQRPGFGGSLIFSQLFLPASAGMYASFSMDPRESWGQLTGYLHWSFGPLPASLALV